MTRTLRTLGIALFAILALGVTASSAMAADHVFTSENEVETVTGTGTGHLFTITSPHLEVECATAKFHGTVNDGASEVTIVPTYEGTSIKYTDPPKHDGHCGSSLGTADVDMNSCAYVLTGETDENGHGDAWIECNGEDEIEVTITEFGTTLSIPAQTPGGGVSFANNGDHVDVNATVENIEYTCHPAFLCGLAGLGTEGNNAHYTGTTTVHGARGPISVSGR